MLLMVAFNSQLTTLSLYKLANKFTEPFLALHDAIRMWSHNSIRDHNISFNNLQYHLCNPQYHPLYSCKFCSSRFFRYMYTHDNHDYLS